jgi:NADPH:quinone reductase-like Zn-dependent oxidoreductase
MLAAVVREHGGVDRVRVEKVPRPEPMGAGNVLVRVRACGLNRLDLFARRGLTGPGLKPRHLPFISGVDIAGEVAQVGGDAAGWTPGDRVVVYPAVSCGECRDCERGEQTMCKGYRIIGEHDDGGLAQFCLVPAKNLESIPEHVPFETAAALPAAYTTAWRMLVTVGRLEPQDRVLVLGASGGVGTAAIQIARRAGALVIALTSGEEKARRLMAAGVNAVIDRDKEDLEASVMRLTGNRGVDVIVNPVAGPSWRAAVRSLAPGGKMMLCGATAGDAPEVSVREIYQSHRQILGAPLGNRSDFRAVLDLAWRGELSPLIDRVLPLEQIAWAHTLLEGNQVVGKLVIAIP